MSSKPSRKQKHQEAYLLPGLKPGLRMKGGVRYDPTINGFVAIVHTWDNILCIGEPEEWRSSEIFSTEDSAMRYYKTTIRPALEQMTAQMAKSNTNVIRRKIEE